MHKITYTHTHKNCILEIISLKTIELSLIFLYYTAYLVKLGNIKGKKSGLCKAGMKVQISQKS